MSSRAPDDLALLRSLIGKLRRAPRVRRLAAGADAALLDELATEAADSLIDIRRSAELLTAELLPNLSTQSPESPEFEETLDDIAEELRHIHYHITNTRLFDYVVGDR
jgi:hypothetical protein